MADAITGILRGAESLTGALGNYYNIQRDKENRRIAEEERAYRKEKDKLALGMKQEYLGMAKEDRAFRRNQAEQEGSMKAFQNMSNLRGNLLNIDGKIAEMESQAMAMPNVGMKGVQLSPKYRQLQRQRQEAKSILNQYMLNDPYAKKFTAAAAMSATGNDAEANLMAKMNGLPASFNQGGISLEDIEGNIIEDVSRDDAISTLEMIDGIGGLTFDKGSKSFFDTSNKMRYDMSGEALKPGEKYKRFSDNVYNAYEGGRIDQADLESVGINTTANNEVLIPKTDKDGNVTSFSKEAISPEAFMANQKALKERQDKRDKMIELGVKEGKLDMKFDAQGNPVFSAVKKPMGWDDLSAGAQMMGLEATNRLINSGYVNMQEVTQVFDEDGELTESIKKNKLKNLRDMSAGEIERWQLALAKSWQTAYDSALANGNDINSAKAFADQRLMTIVPSENDALKQQADETPKGETKEPKKPVKAFEGDESTFQERLDETPFQEAKRKLKAVPKNFLSNIKAMASEDFDAIGKDLTKNKEKRGPEAIDALEKVRVIQELTEDQSLQLAAGLRTEDKALDKKVANVLKALEKSKGWLLPFKNFTEVDFQKSSPLFKRAVKDLKSFLQSRVDETKSAENIQLDMKTLEDLEKSLFIDGRVKDGQVIE